MTFCCCLCSTSSETTVAARRPKLNSRHLCQSADFSRSESEFPHVKWNVSLLRPLTTLHFPRTSIINQRNRTNGTILLGHFYNCIFSRLSLLHIIYSGCEHCLQLLDQHKPLPPSISNMCLTTVRMLFAASVVYFSICFFFCLRPAAGTADGGITTDSALILNTIMQPFKRFKRHQNGMVSFCLCSEPDLATNRIFPYVRLETSSLPFTHALLSHFIWFIFVKYSLFILGSQEKNTTENAPK